MGRDAYLHELKTKLSSGAISADTYALLKNVTEWFDDKLPPTEGQTAAVALETPKTAALCYDRVWVADPAAPRDVAFRSFSSVAALVMLAAAASRQSSGLPEGDPLREAYSAGAETVLRTYDQVMPGDLAEGVGAITRRIAWDLERELSVPLVPIYHSARRRDQEFEPGSREVLVATISSLPVADEATLTWDQVLEFRRDEQVRRKYRRLTHWLDKEMNGKSLGYVQDEMSIRLEDYIEGLRKHGIKTVLGTLATTLDSKAVIGGAAAVASLSYAPDLTWAVVAGAGIVIGRAAIHVANSLLDVQTLRAGTNPEIAFLAELQERMPRGPAA